MIALKNQPTPEEFVAVHPLFDVPEEKRSGENLGKMEMSGRVRASLLLLRVYIVLVSLLLVFHLLDRAGMFGRQS